jgi:hypothetical protein
LPLPILPKGLVTADAPSESEPTNTLFYFTLNFSWLISFNCQLSLCRHVFSHRCHCIQLLHIPIHHIVLNEASFQRCIATRNSDNHLDTERLIRTTGTHTLALNKRKGGGFDIIYPRAMLKMRSPNDRRSESETKQVLVWFVFMAS